MAGQPLDLPAGVITGENVRKLFAHAQANGYAIPAVNVTSSSVANACLEAAKKANSPIILQLSAGGAQFFAGKSVKNTNDAAAILGAEAAAYHIRTVAKAYGVPVVLHSDHCAKKLLKWFEGMVQLDEAYYKKNGEPLFSSHMLDLSEEPLDENIKVCEQYMKRLAAVDCWLEMELGITGGEEDGVNNEGVDNALMYSQPDEVWRVYRSLAAIGPNFTIAAAFGNVHGVYAPGNVTLRPEILGNSQRYIANQLGSASPLPVMFVFHGGSGSLPSEIKLAITNGVVKMNIDTDTQWAYWSGLRSFEAKNHDYLQGQIGNPKGPQKPNKKFYDPRVWLRAAEESMRERVIVAYENLNSINVLGLGKAKL
jgi:fructose-bisphosphate aldolase class II